MTTFKLSTIPGNLQWQHSPVAWQVQGDNSLVITAGPEADWFIDPAGNHPKDNAPVALFAPTDENFMLRAKVTVDFAATFDAGVLQIRETDDLWAKLCFEYSPQQQPMIVSVVTRGVSDDCNSQPIEGREVYLRLTRQAEILAFHYSQDGRYWPLVRYFTLGPLRNVRVGFSSQSPTGQGCRAIFSEISYRPGILKDLRSGE
jgi:regulation of enolase protein 1 (concanavalin A-like superfamily)